MKNQINDAGLNPTPNGDGSGSDFQELIGRQTELQVILGSKMTSDIQGFISEQILCLCAEAMEALAETPWKSWKKHQSFNPEAFDAELVDIQLFLLNIIAARGITGSQFMASCQEKQKIIAQRQIEGY